MMGINSFEQVKQVDRAKGKIHDLAIFSGAIGNRSAGISTTERFGKLLRAHKLTIGIFIVLAAFGSYPIIFVGMFTHWYAYVLSYFC